MNTATLSQELDLLHEEMEAIAVEKNTVTMILTQVRENYGAHDWDGEGEAPQYWKNKGGSVYIFKGTLTSEQEIQIKEAINSADEYYEEFVIAAEETTNPTDFHDDWETPLELSFEDDQLILTEDIKFNNFGLTKFELHPGGLRNKI